MSQGSLLSDELLRHLMAVGHVDVLVGVPTLDNAATVGAVVRAVHKSFAGHFLRQRTVLLNCDGGSTDGTPEAVRQASLKSDEIFIAPQALRTTHRISVPYHGVPGKAAALRTLFAAAELSQARAVAVFDADVTSVTPDWLERLVRPIFDGRADFVSPLFPRHPLDGTLVTQLVRPAMRAAYGRRALEPLASEFACSGAFAAHCLAQEVWDGPLSSYAIDLWLTGSAFAGGFRCAQAPLGARVLGVHTPRPGLPEVFRQVVGSLFACLQAHEGYWPQREGSDEVPVYGEATPAPGEPARVDPLPMLAAFRTGVPDLAPVLRDVLSAETLARVEELARGGDEAVSFDDELWVAAVYEAAAAWRRGALHREHLVSALVPLYLGRTASFLLENDESDAATVAARLEELCRRYESAKPRLVRGWTAASER